MKPWLMHDRLLYAQNYGIIF